MNNIIGGNDANWAYSNMDGDRYANLSIGKGSHKLELGDSFNDVFGALATGGLTNIVKPQTALGSVLYPNQWGNIGKEWTSGAKNAANTLNKIDPKVKFPLKDTTDCVEIAAVKNAVMLESTGVSASSASSYKSALVAYIGYLDQLRAYNDCEAKEAAKKAQDKIAQDIAAAKAALGLSRDVDESGAASGGISAITIGFIAGGILLTILVVSIVRKKS